jgi:thiamine biosynthesis lipoprotein
MRRIVLASIVLGGLIVGLLVGRLVWTRCGGTPAAAPEPALATFTQEIMTSPISVTVPVEDGAPAARIVFDVFRDVDARMSEWKASSPLSAVNAAASREAVAVPPDLRALIRRGLEMGELTGGAFDITWAALWGLWDFKAETPRVPADTEIDARVALVGGQRVVIDDDDGTVFLPERGMVIGLGGIAKGHALDRSAVALRKAGVERFLISAGGQLMLGASRGERGWRVGIRDPRGAPDDAFASLELTETSVSSSGDYERFFVLDGVRYHHILDPRTGRPARGLRGVTVVARDATLADALSTALMVLGRERAVSLVESLDGVEAVLVDDDAAVHVTSGLAGRLRWMTDG